MRRSISGLVPWGARAMLAMLAMLALGELTACSDLSSIDPGVCGNGAVDPGEDCDGASGSGTCGAVGDANACHFVCGGGATCPTGYACGGDTRCRAPSGTFALAPGVYPFPDTQVKAADVDGDGIADLTGVVGDSLFVRYGSGDGDMSATSTQVIPATTGTLGYGDLDGDGRNDIVVPTSFGIVTLLGTQERAFSPFAYSSIPLSSSVGAIHVEPIQPAASPLSTSTLLTAYDQLGFGAATLHNQMRYSANSYGTCLDGTTRLDMGSAADPDCPSGSGATAFEDLLGGDLVVGRTGASYAYTLKVDGTTTVARSSTTPALDPTDDVAIVKPATKTVVLLSPCSLLDMTGTAYPNTLALRIAQASISVGAYNIATDGRAMFTDIDGDGWTDLEVPVSSASAVFSVLYNDGTGVLMPGTVVAPSAFMTITAIGGAPVPIGRPRLFANLDGVGAADLVTDQQIFIGNCVGVGPACNWHGQGVSPTTRNWTSVVAVDINHDGRLDIAGMVAGQPDVDVMLNAGALLFDRFTIPTDAPVKSVVVGDFDGDLVSDLAIVAGDITASDENDEVAVVFGATDGGPPPPIVMGTFGVIDSIAPASIAASIADIDAATDLVVVSDRNGSRHGAALLGNSSREVVAPFLTTTPLTLRPGTFDDSPGLDVASIDVTGAVSLLSGAGDGDLTVTSVTSFGVLECAGTMGPASTCPVGTTASVDSTNAWTGGCIASADCPAPVRGSCSGTISTSCRPASNPEPACPTGTFASQKNGCWDGYCLTEAQCLVTSPAAIWGTGGIAAASPMSIVAVHSITPAAISATTAGGGSSTDPCTTSAMTDLTVMTPPMTTGGPWTIVGPTLLPAPLACRHAFSQATRDLDGDGEGDLLVALCPGSTSCNTGTTYVVWANNGALDLSTMTALAPQDPNANCVRFQPVQLDLDPALELIATCVDDGAYSAHIFDLAGDRTWSEIAVFPLAASPGDLVVGDFNGDHLVDFMTTTSTTVSGADMHVYLQCAAGDPACAAIATEGP